ncbi:sugar phosphate nucleotidyltransferase [Candidatus Nitrospira allomarina]|uniref:Sugar phosphate nucleotidyltransferase n=1 Tax=Candidatus Nitrospira allomarina TaxID=3020900 RepID=A0AA96JTX0_9BACT|nr:sugar phosphate nucleotidyltransferase [Candidatus Nitrospira allomarina]WNM60043.1 sugar phosphate nucleotidyltransferase [Candidatus Nitrospira allomarina]
MSQSHALWSVILAGGKGERTRPFIERWLGYPKPKQYCAFVGNRSMLQHTLDRADRLGAPHKKITVVAQTHQGFAGEALGGQRAGQVILEPNYCGTASGMFLPLTYVRAWDPSATVVIFPSDHFVFPENRFLELVRRAISGSRILQDRLLLLGVRPTHLELDYGWMNVGGVLGWSGGSCIRQVDSFVEQLDHIQALNAMAKGALWNTSVIVGKVSTIWRLGWQFVPAIMERFERLGKAIGSTHEGRMLRQLYQKMPILDVSTEFLQRVPERLGMIELEDVLWSDWEGSDRIRHTLNVIGKEPAFPSELVTMPCSSSHALSFLEVTR